MTLTGFDISVFPAFIAAVILLSMLRSRREKNTVAIFFLPRFLRADVYTMPRSDSARGLKVFC